jgi:hypothetical protein
VEDQCIVGEALSLAIKDTEMALETTAMVLVRNHRDKPVRVTATLLGSVPGQKGTYPMGLKAVTILIDGAPVLPAGPRGSMSYGQIPPGAVGEFVGRNEVVFVPQRLLVRAQEP